MSCYIYSIIYQLDYCSHKPTVVVNEKQCCLKLLLVICTVFGQTVFCSVCAEFVGSENNNNNCPDSKHKSHL